MPHQPIGGLKGQDQSYPGQSKYSHSDGNCNETEKVILGLYLYYASVTILIAQSFLYLLQNQKLLNPLEFDIGMHLLFRVTQKP